MKLLYSHLPTAPAATDPAVHIRQFVPGLRKGLFLPGEPKSIKGLLVRLSFWFQAGGKFKIFYAVDQDGTLMHTSCVLPKCYKFPYMNKGDYVIGPCVTYPQYRGRGIYPKVLKYILGNITANAVYMVVDEHNTSSVRGIEKAGFTRSGTIRKTKFLKRYYLEEGIQ